MVRFIGSLVVGFLVVATASAQAPPQPLPPSITGTPLPAPIVPAAGIATTTAPIARFANLNAYPPETVAAIYSLRAGSDWLWRMNQSNGRFFPGLLPAVRMPLDSDLDVRQAYATLALAEAARFTGDERYAARATQAALALLTLTRLDPADATCRVPALAADKGNSVPFAALLCLALLELPNADAKLLADAEALGVYLRKRIQPSGAILMSDEPTSADSDADAMGSGLALRALVATHKLKPDAAKKDAILRAIGYSANQFKARKSPQLAAAMIPAVADVYLNMGKDPALAALAFEMADTLCGCQYSRADARSVAWVGGFKLSSPEPGLDSLQATSALAMAAKLTRQVPDLTRFVRYRQAANDGLAFARSLQFSDENAEHFEKAYRVRFLVGGAHLSPSDGTVRIDATGQLVSAQLAFLQSGAESRSD